MTHIRLRLCLSCSTFAFFAFCFACVLSSIVVKGATEGESSGTQIFLLQAQQSTRWELIARNTSFLPGECQNATQHVAGTRTTTSLSDCRREAVEVWLNADSSRVSVPVLWLASNRSYCTFYICPININNSPPPLGAFFISRPPSAKDRGDLYVGQNSTSTSIANTLLRNRFCSSETQCNGNGDIVASDGYSICTCLCYRNFRGARCEGSVSAPVSSASAEGVMTFSVAYKSTVPTSDITSTANRSATAALLVALVQQQFGFPASAVALNRLLPQFSPAPMNGTVVIDAPRHLFFEVTFSPSTSAPLVSAMQAQLLCNSGQQALLNLLTSTADLSSYLDDVEGFSVIPSNTLPLSMDSTLCGLNHTANAPLCSLGKYSSSSGIFIPRLIHKIRIEVEEGNDNSTTFGDPLLMPSATVEAHGPISYNFTIPLTRYRRLPSALAPFEATNGSTSSSVGGGGVTNCTRFLYGEMQLPLGIHTTLLQIHFNNIASAPSQHLACPNSGASTGQARVTVYYPLGADTLYQFQAMGTPNDFGPHSDTLSATMESPLNDTSLTGFTMFVVVVVFLIFSIVGCCQLCNGQFGWAVFGFSGSIAFVTLAFAVVVFDYGTVYYSTTSVLFEEFTSSDCDVGYDASMNRRFQTVQGLGFLSHRGLRQPYRIGEVRNDAAAPSGKLQCVFVPFATTPVWSAQAQDSAFPERGFWAAARCTAIEKSTRYENGTTMLLKVGPSQSACDRSPWQSIVARKCYPEGSVFQNRSSSNDNGNNNNNSASSRLWEHYVQFRCLQKSIVDRYVAEFLTFGQLSLTSSSTTPIDRVQVEPVPRIVGEWSNRSLLSWRKYNADTAVLTTALKINAENPAIVSFSTANMSTLLAAGYLKEVERVATRRANEQPSFLEPDAVSRRKSYNLSELAPKFLSSSTDTHVYESVQFAAPFLNFGAKGQFTITFWIKADENTNGFVFILADNWLVSEEAGGVGNVASSPLVEELQRRLNNGVDNPSQLLLSSTYRVHLAVYLRGPTDSLHVLYSYPTDDAAHNGEAANMVFQFSRSGTSVINPYIFDGRWHMIALTRGDLPGSQYFQIFVDGKSAYQDSTWRRCIPSTIPIITELPPTVPVSSGTLSRSTVKQGGALHIGALNNGTVYALEVFDQELTQVQIARLGTATMRKNNDVDTTGARVAGGFILALFLIALLMHLVQFISPLVRSSDPSSPVSDNNNTTTPTEPAATQEIPTVVVGEKEKESSDEEEEETQAKADAAGETKGERTEGAVATAKKKQATVKGAANNVRQATDAVKATTSASQKISQSPGLVKQIAIIVPMLATVIQSMLLYFQGWSWPLEFEVPFRLSLSWLYPDLRVALPDIPVSVTFGFEMTVACLVVLVLFTLAYRDDEAFRFRVIDPILEAKSLGKDYKKEADNDQLPNPLGKNTPAAMLRFDIGDLKVTGGRSRRLVQGYLESVVVPDAAEDLKSSASSKKSSEDGRENDKNSDDDEENACKEDEEDNEAWEDSSANGSQLSIGSNLEGLRYDETSNSVAIWVEADVDVGNPFTTPLTERFKHCDELRRLPHYIIDIAAALVLVRHHEISDVSSALKSALIMIGVTGINASTEVDDGRDSSDGDDPEEVVNDGIELTPVIQCFCYWLRGGSIETVLGEVEEALTSILTELNELVEKVYNDYAYVSKPPPTTSDTADLHQSASRSHHHEAEYEEYQSQIHYLRHFYAQAVELPSYTVFVQRFAPVLYEFFMFVERYEPFIFNAEGLSVAVDRSGVRLSRLAKQGLLEMIRTQHQEYEDDGRIDELRAIVQLQQELMATQSLRDLGDISHLNKLLHDPLQLTKRYSSYVPQEQEATRDVRLEGEEDEEFAQRIERETLEEYLFFSGEKSGIALIATKHDGNNDLNPETAAAMGVENKRDVMFQQSLALYSQQHQGLSPRVEFEFNDILSSFVLGDFLFNAFAVGMQEFRSSDLRPLSMHNPQDRRFWSLYLWFLVESGSEEEILLRVISVWIQNVLKENWVYDYDAWCELRNKAEARVRGEATVDILASEEIDAIDTANEAPEHETTSESKVAKGDDDWQNDTSCQIAVDENLVNSIDDEKAEADVGDDDEAALDEEVKEGSKEAEPEREEAVASNNGEEGVQQEEEDVQRDLANAMDSLQNNYELQKDRYKYLPVGYLREEFVGDALAEALKYLEDLLQREVRNSLKSRHRDRDLTAARLEIGVLVYRLKAPTILDSSRVEGYWCPLVFNPATVAAVEGVQTGAELNAKMRLQLEKATTEVAAIHAKVLAKNHKRTTEGSPTPPEREKEAPAKQPVNDHGGVVVKDAQWVLPNDAFFLPLVTKPYVVYCPLHQYRLIPAVSDLHHEIRKKRPKAYPCALKKSAVFRYTCMKPDEDDAPCDAEDFYVCQHNDCNFAVCCKCQRLKAKYKLVAKFSQQLFVWERKGAIAVIGLILVTLCQALYLPAVSAAMTIVFCHSSLQCDYPTCYSPPQNDFLFLVFASTIVLDFAILGLTVFMFMVVYRRKKLLLDMGIFPDDQLEFRGKTPEHRVPDSFLEVVSCDVPIEEWSFITRRDQSMFKSIYEQYEFRYMTMHPLTLLIKVLLLLVVLFVAEPNSLLQLILCALVESLQLMFFTFTEPFVDPWIDLMQKAGCLHQVAQLGLMAFYRAATADDPNDNNISYVMLGLSGLYVVIVLVVIVFVVIIPIAKSIIAGRREKKAREEEELARKEAKILRDQLREETRRRKKEHRHARKLQLKQKKRERRGDAILLDVTLFFIKSSPADGAATQESPHNPIQSGPAQSDPTRVKRSGSAHHDEHSTSANETGKERYERLLKKHNLVRVQQDGAPLRRRVYLAQPADLVFNYSLESLDGTYSACAIYDPSREYFALEANRSWGYYGYRSLHPETAAPDSTKQGHAEVLASHHHIDEETGLPVFAVQLDARDCSNDDDFETQDNPFNDPDQYEEDGDNDDNDEEDEEEDEADEEDEEEEAEEDEEDSATDSDEEERKEAAAVAKRRREAEESAIVYQPDAKWADAVEGDTGVTTRLVVRTAPKPKSAVVAKPTNVNLQVLPQREERRGSVASARSSVSSISRSTANRLQYSAAAGRPMGNPHLALQEDGSTVREIVVVKVHSASHAPVSMAQFQVKGGWTVEEFKRIVLEALIQAQARAAREEQKAANGKNKQPQQPPPAVAEEASCLVRDDVLAAWRLVYNGRILDNALRLRTLINPLKDVSPMLKLEQGVAPTTWVGDAPTPRATIKDPALGSANGGN